VQLIQHCGKLFHYSNIKSTSYFCTMSFFITLIIFKKYICINSIGLAPIYNPLGNLNSGRRQWAKLIRSASVKRVFDAAIAKLLWRLVSRCFYMSICVFSTMTLNWGKCVLMGQNVYRQSPDGDTDRFLTIILAVCRILDKLHSLSMYR